MEFGDLKSHVVWITAASFFILVWVLTQMSPVLQYYVKYGALHLYFLLLAIVSGIFCLYRPGSSKNIKFPKFFSKFFMIERIKTENLEWMETCSKPCVIISNHQSTIDTHITLVACPVGTACLAKKVLFYIPFFGIVCWLCGTIFIDRKKGQKAVEIMKCVGRDMREKVTNIWIFPEGTRFQGDTIGSFKKGAFHLAIQAQVPIVPIVVSNTRNVLDTGNRRFYGGSIRVKCLESVSTYGLTSADVDKLIKRCHAMMVSAFNKDFEDNKNNYANLLPIKKKN